MMLPAQNSDALPLPLVVAHRSNNGENSLPENTLLALQRAHERGCQWVECDVNLTADGIAVIIHDDTLRRTTNADDTIADTPIAQLTYAEINSCDAGIKYGAEFAGTKIPSLKDFLTLIKEYDMGLLLEIKPSRGIARETVRHIIGLLEEMNLMDYPKLLIQSFLPECLEEAYRLAPHLNLGLIIASWGVVTYEDTGIPIDKEAGIYLCKESVATIFNDLQCKALVANANILDKVSLQTFRQATSANHILAWTVDDPTMAKELRANGVDTLISDHPERMMTLNLTPSLLSLPIFWQTNIANVANRNQHQNINERKLNP